ncbi:putative disease resistance protein RGA1 [Spinacia oleracea]|uniref:Disease resistance protein RGA1 n=1 Tax=Spinacia oleracea TaxID=3562 RepID=A0A9R0JQP2_SPIOL|nr:putative disease resistance protein RGA1 [Spinacia oleracea]
MAEAILCEVAKTIIEKLGSGAYKKLVYAKDLDSHITSLQELKTTIEATLVDAETLETCSNSQQDVLNKLRTALAELDDFLDEQADKVELKQVMRGNKLIKPVRLFFSESNQLVSPLRDATKLKTILKKFDCIARNHAQFGSIVSSPSLNQSRGRGLQMATSSILHNLVVGREGDRNNIVSMLSEDSMTTETVSVDSIFGIDGMGKTTLARYVFNDQRVKGCFDAHFWVSVTPDFNVEAVLRKIIDCGMGELPHNCDAVQLCHHFIQAIGGKKFLLVLDNIWDHASLREKWVNLKSLLECGAKGSKVLLTTCNKKVAKIMDSVNPYQLRGLTEEDSWLLFQKIAFTQYQEPGVEAIGMEISKMCPNMPLVIRSVGGILASKHTIQEWQAFRDEQQHADFASYGDVVEHTLKLSYNHLDENLKRCVTYCTLFKKGGSFLIEQMIHRWIALGYVKPQLGQILEEAGEQYMLSLQDFGFLQISSTDPFCTMHDVMYEVVLSQAGVKYKVADSNTDKFDQKVRHLSICNVATNSNWEVPSSIFKIKHLESFIRGNSYYSYIFKGSRIKASNLSSCYKLISKFQSLKVLDLNGVGIKELPTSVGDLFCLRFLNLTGTDIVKLPNSITKLVALQSLYLRDCPNLEELPRDISKLENLRHLLLQGSEKLSRMPMGLGNLTNLRTLDVFIVSEQMANVGNLADLKRLGNLGRELSIIVHRESKYITSSEISSVNLKMKGKLKDLYIDFKNGTKEDERVLEGLQPPSNLKVLSIAGYGGERLPGWMMDQLECCLPNLHAICIRDCKACRYLCSFGRLPYLDFLCLKWCDNVEYIEDNTSSSNANNSDNLVDDKLPPAPLFPSLVTLEVYGMPKLKGWWRMSSSRGEQDSKELLQVQRHQNHNVVNRKPTFLALFMLIVFYVKLAIAIARQQIHNFTSLSVFSMPKLKGRWRIWLSGDEDSRELIQVQSHHLDNWKPAFPKLDILTVEIVELAIIITRRQIHNFTSLKHLRITNDWNVGQSDPQRQALTLRSSCFSNLHSLRFRDNKELELLPENFQDLFLGMSSLKELRFESCEQLKAIPEWIDNLTSLTMLSLTECPRLESLPQQISNLPNLKTLQICACPILTERGKKREYWPFIKHIPQIFTD